MGLEFRVENKTLIVSVDGEIDHHSSKELREKIDKEIDKNPIKNLVFDFNEVDFMDSSGIGMVIGRYKNIQKYEGKIGIINLNPQIKRIFEISGLFKIIPFYENINKAMEDM